MNIYLKWLIAFMLVVICATSELCRAQTFNTILNGNGPPTSALGNPGDYYMNNNTTCLYGPKTTVWPSGCVLVRGTTWHVGTVPPTATTPGSNGDFYLDTITHCYYGPKTNGVWPKNCVPTVGPPGVPGTVASGVLPPGPCIADDSRYSVDNTTHTMTIYVCDPTTLNAVRTTPLPLDPTGDYGSTNASHTIVHGVVHGKRHNTGH